MSEPIPPVTPASVKKPHDAKAPRTRFPINQATAQGLTDDTTTIQNALDAVTADALLASDLSSHFLDVGLTLPINSANLKGLHDRAVAAAQLGADIVNEASLAVGSTDAETVAGDAAVRAIRKVQSGAKEKYEETTPTRLAAYYVGQPIGSRTQLEQAATAIWGLVGNVDAQGNPVAPQDTVPGVQTADLPQLKIDLGAYVLSQATQGAAKMDESDARLAYQNGTDLVAGQRRRLQRAADAERPFSPENAPIRRLFGLPTDRGLS